MRAQLFALCVVVLLSGCFGPKPHDRREPEAKCLYGHTCIADPNSRDAQVALSEHGVQQLLTGGSYYGLQRNADLLVWAGAYAKPFRELRDANGTVMALDLTRSRLIDVGNDPNVHFTQPHVSDGYVVFGRGTQMGLWDSRTGSHRVISMDSRGNWIPHDFDYPWVVCITFAPSDLAGVWALNVETNESFLVEPGRPQGSPRSIPSGMAVAGSNAYVTVLRGNITTGEATEILETNLATRKQTVIYRFEEADADEPGVEWPYLIWSEVRNVDEIRVRVMDLRTRDVADVFDPDKGDASFPKIAAGWVLAERNDDIWGHHLASGKETLLVNRTKDFIPASQWTTDGARLYFNAMAAGSSFEKDQEGVFRKEMPIS